MINNLLKNKLIKMMNKINNQIKQIIINNKLFKINIREKQL